MTNGRHEGVWVAPGDGPRRAVVGRAAGGAGRLGAGAGVAYGLAGIR